MLRSSVMWPSIVQPPACGLSIEWPGATGWLRCESGEEGLAGVVSKVRGDGWSWAAGSCEEKGFGGRHR